MEVEKIVREYIDKTVHMSLATVSDSTPWVCEVHFSYDQNLNLYFRSLKSRRHSQEIDANPNVAGNIIDRYDLGAEVVGVYFEGTAELLTPGQKQNQAAKCLKTRLKIDKDVLVEASHEDGHQFYKITVRKWYVFGKFGQESADKYQLNWNA